MTWRETPTILLITRNLPPLLGGMERMMQEVVNGLAEYSQLTVIGPKGCQYYLPKNIAVHEVSPSLAAFLARAALKSVSLGRQLRT